MRGTLILFALTGALLLGAACRGHAVTVSLGWNPSPSAGVTGYYIYFGSSTNINNMTPVPVGPGSTNLAIGGLVNGQTYYFTATSHDSAFDQSSPSPAIAIVAGSVAQGAAGMLSAAVGLPAGQFGFALSGAASGKYAIQASTDLVHWVSLQTNTAPFQFVDSNTAGFSRRFYRTVFVSN
ncbi:MAG TPA: fibronectin type III domain-containing protein [Verrucomicrobiae bacterium]|jgi:hypothetical protein|nr:fibronectin type III domain-containing protein [Verrucomicrobiae bacterium]